MTMRRQILIGLVAIAMGAAACGGDDGGAPATTSEPTAPVGDTTPSTIALGGYEPAAADRAEAIADAVGEALGAPCDSFAFNDKVDVEATQQRLGSDVIPTAQATCTAFSGSDGEELLEITTVRSRNEAKRYAQDRADALCAQAAKRDVFLSGLRWVVGDDYAMQPDTEGLSRRIAAGLDGEYFGTPCPGDRGFDWDADAVATVTETASRLSAAGLGCESFQLSDRDQLQASPHYRNTGLPSAMGVCASGGKPLEIAVGDASTTPALTFARSEFQYQCGNVEELQALVADDLVALAPRAVMAQVTDLLGGELLTLDCASTRP